jgi:hypothetical protein
MKPTANPPIKERRVTRSIAFEPELLVVGVKTAKSRRQSFSAYLCSLLADANRSTGRIQ